MNDNGVLVSVVIPYHERPALLPRAVKSVIDQTHDNLEVIVVDGASRDDPRELLASFRDPRIPGPNARLRAPTVMASSPATYPRTRSLHTVFQRLH